MKRPHSTERALFPLSLRLLDLIQTVRVMDILQRTVQQVETVHELLDRTGRGEWRRTPAIVRYDWSANKVEPSPGDLPATAIAADEVPTQPGPLFPIALLTSPEA